mgnify:FL=1
MAATRGVPTKSTRFPSQTQFPHTMTSYAAVNSLVSLGAFDSIHRKELYRFFLSQKLPDGSFRVHVNG